MNRSIRRLGIGLLVCYAVLFLQLNRIQLVDAGRYNARPDNDRQAVEDFSNDRGRIVTADGQIVAESVEVDDRYRMLRRYPAGNLYGPVSGYFSLLYGTSGIERRYNDDLTGRSIPQLRETLADILGGRRQVGSLTLTIRSTVQQAARDALGDRPGSVVALDPRTGAVLALWSTPTVDPNDLSSHDLDAVRDARALYLLNPEKPLLPAATGERYFPGSTFKIVTAAAGLESGTVTRDSPSYPVTATYTPPQTTRPIRNFGGGTCGGTLIEILRVSCNTAFAQMGVEVGAEQMVRTATAFGFGERLPLDLPDDQVARSVYPPVGAFVDDIPKLAQTAFGQNDVQATPLHMAVVAAAVANGGRIMTPYLVQDVTNVRGEVVRTTAPSLWRTAIAPSTAALLTEAMRAVVERGTATRMQIPGVAVAGKTGTAQLGTDPPSSHAWVIGFAPADAPTVAVAVLVKAQPGVSEVTGGRVAAPIARQVIEAALAP